VRREQSEQVLDARMQCLDDRLARMRALTSVLAHADETVVQHAAATVDSLPRVADCSDLRRMHTSVPAPSDAAQATARAAVASDVARAAALFAAGKYEDSKVLAARTLEAAQPVGDLQLEAEALYWLGTTQGMLDDPVCETTLQRAGAAAELAGAHELAARAWIEIGYEVGFRQSKPAVGVQFLRYAQSAIAKLGGDDRLEGRRLTVEAVLDLGAGRSRSGAQRGTAGRGASGFHAR
jgi:hypothetical protein